EVTNANDRLTGFCIEFLGAKVGFPFGSQDLGWKTFVFAGADHGKVAAIWAACGFFIEVDGDVQLLSHTLREFLCPNDTFFKADARNGNQWRDVGGPHAWMSTFVVAHIDEFGSFCDAPECSFDDIGRFPDEGYDCAVGACPRIDIEQ